MVEPDKQLANSAEAVGEQDAPAMEPSVSVAEDGSGEMMPLIGAAPAPDASPQEVPAEKPATDAPPSLAAELAEMAAEPGQTANADDASKPSATLPVSPPGPKPPGARPVCNLKPACVDLSDLGDSQDCLDLSASGAPRKAIPVLRKKKTDATATKKKTTCKAKEEKVEEVEPWELVLSERAMRETAMLEMLHTREFTFNEWGRVEIDDHADQANSARSLVDMPPGLSPEELSKLKPGRLHRYGYSARHGVRASSRAYIRNSHVPLSTDRNASESENEDDSDKDLDEDAYYEPWKEFRQRQVNLNFIKSELREKALLGHVSTNMSGLIAAAGGVTGLCAAGAGLDVGMGSEPKPVGSEPPPTPAIQRDTKRRRDYKAEDGGKSEPSMVDERYLNACAFVGLNSKPDVLKTLRVIEKGASSLPVDFCHKTYLGNRGGQVFFLTLAGGSSEDAEDFEIGELSELRTLELPGQGLGNEAACALAQLLPRCPRLRQVNLARNHVSETGAQALIQEIHVHPALDSLNLDQNPVPSWLRVRLKEILASRKEDPWYDAGEATRRLLVGTCLGGSQKKDGAGARLTTF